MMHNPPSGADGIVGVFLRATAIAVAIALPAPAAHAAVVTFSGKDLSAGAASPRPNSDAAAASFATAAAALGLPTQINFEAAPLGAFHNLAVATGVTMNGVDQLTSGDQTVRNAPLLSPDKGAGYNTTPGGLKFVLISGGTLTFTFSQGISAFGAYLTGLQSDIGGPPTLTFNDGSARSLSIPAPGIDGGAAYFGFTDQGKSITSVTITLPGDIAAVDDVSYVSVPEPAALTLLTLLAPASLRRRRAR